MIYSIDSATASISNSYVDALKEMSSSLARLGSGKRFQTASEDIGSYLKVNSLQTSQNQLQSSKDSIASANGFFMAAAAYGSNILDQLEDLKSKAFQMEGATGAELAELTLEYTGILNSLTESLLTEYNGVGLNPTAGATYETVRMANGGSLDLAFVAGDSVTIGLCSYLTDYATTAARLDTEIGKATSFVSKVGGYQAQVEAQSSFVNTMLENFEAAENSITAINEASEMANYAKNDIRQQAAVAMMAQANVSRLGILNLYR